MELFQQRMEPALMVVQALHVCAVSGHIVRVPLQAFVLPQEVAVLTEQRLAFRVKIAGHTRV